MDGIKRMSAGGMRAGLAGVWLLGAAACAPAIPESGPGPGFSGFGAAPAAPRATAPLPPEPPRGFDPAAAAAAIDRAEGLTTTPGAPMVIPGSAVPLDPNAPLPALTPAPLDGPLDPNRPRGDAPSNIQIERGEMIGSAGISDEQDFNAVASRETIASDAERLQRNRANYQVIPPTALPERPSDTGPNIVQYALTTGNGVGEPAYSRSAVRLTSPDAACARYASADLAQEAFLANGGPARDPRGLDPDGDGFACDWDPGPFRAALN
jgi:hypothetical protein